ncbi:PhoH family protein [Candidatus Fermentibacterales bacterium]|nr:PhoH family protein [Candidatus Fermentibacterales bacterium]
MSDSDDTRPDGIRVRIEDAPGLFGPGDAVLRSLGERFGVKPVYREGYLRFSGEDDAIERACGAVRELQRELRLTGRLDDQSLERVLRFSMSGGDGPELKVPGRAGFVVPRTPGQASYLKAVGRSEIVISIGPAGTGKTFLAVACAVSCLRSGAVERIIITRPAVEAGENLGFLPGDLQQKIDPYLRPIYDALNDTLSPQRVKRSMDSGVIEVAPLAYMRGRTLNNAFVILDEAQNTTVTQLKMFLTRLGHTSRAVITGDITQIDLQPVSRSGLVVIQTVLADIDGVEFVYLDETDVVRHPLVQKVISAFSRYTEGSGRDG